MIVLECPALRSSRMKERSPPLLMVIEVIPDVGSADADVFPLSLSA